MREGRKSKYMCTGNPMELWPIKCKISDTVFVRSTLKYNESKVVRIRAITIPQLTDCIFVECGNCKKLQKYGPNMSCSTCNKFNSVTSKNFSKIHYQLSVQIVDSSGSLKMLMTNAEATKLLNMNANEFAVLDENELLKYKHGLLFKEFVFDLELSRAAIKIVRMTAID